MEEIKSLETVRMELEKIKEKYQKKAEKERAKINDIYVVICGEKCYTEAEINDWVAADYISAAQSDRYIEKLEKKQAAAGQADNLTASERICRTLDNLIMNVSAEIRDIKYRQEKEIEKQGRWKRAQEQGYSYKEWLDMEEVNQRSEEYEILMGLKQ